MQSSTDTSSALSTRRGKLTLALICLAGFLDFVDTTIVNVALPSIKHGLGFSVQNLQWVISGYLLTYGGLLLLGGRTADLLGRRRMLVTGTTLFALASLAAGLATTDTAMIAARLAQGLGAATMTPAALSILTTTFTTPADRIKALGIWSATVPLASALGVTLGGVLSEGFGWRAVFLVNVPVAGFVVVAAMRLLEDDNKRAARRDFDLPGAVLGTGGLLLLVYALVNAPQVGWATTRTFAELAGAGVLLVGFVVVEQRQSNPLVPFSIFRIDGLAAADATQVIAQAGFLSMFFFITLYMQNVLGFSPVVAGLAYLPVTVGVGIAAGISTQLVARTGTRPVTVVGALIGAGGVYWLAQIPVRGSYLTDLLPGLVVMALGLGAVMVGVQNAANAGVPADKAGLAAALITTSSTVGAALGLAILTAIAAGTTRDLTAAHVSPVHALTGGFHAALVACSIFLIGAAVIAARATSTRGQQQISEAAPEPAPIFEVA
ncbi:MAG: DHA2 family efflux MFS transporter permease subunit [Actinomycetota bacterium]|nr:DHA2 family efflux MFS transporter permease subunit [Actinomycetota bacterium]